jgi:hypothetical protein
MKVGRMPMTEPDKGSAESREGLCSKASVPRNGR